jgi:hypothetical protein
VAACSGIGCPGCSAATTGKSAALVGSGLLVDRHRALLAAAVILLLGVAVATVLYGLWLLDMIAFGG